MSQVNQFEGPGGYSSHNATVVSSDEEANSLLLLENETALHCKIVPRLLLAMLIRLKTDIVSSRKTSNREQGPTLQ